MQISQPPSYRAQVTTGVNQQNAREKQAFAVVISKLVLEYYLKHVDYVPVGDAVSGKFGRIKAKVS